MQQRKEEQKAMLFVNWSDEDFTHKFDGDEYTIKAGQSTYFKKFMAELFAKHFVDRELNKLNLTTMDSSRKELLKRCFGEEFSSKSDEKIENEMLNKNKEFDKNEEESFEGLKGNETAKPIRNKGKK